jgi:hypothetical protein
MGAPTARETAMAHDTAAFWAAFSQPSAAMTGPLSPFLAEQEATEATLWRRGASERLGLEVAPLCLPMTEGDATEKASAVVAPANMARPHSVILLTILAGGGCDLDSLGSSFRTVISFCWARKRGGPGVVESQEERGGRRGE